MSKEDDFKERFIALMQNLRTAGSKDAEAMWLMGSLAARLLDKSKTRSWAQFKQTRTTRGYAKLLSDFEAQGNAFHTQKKMKQAYAIQVLAISMVARTQKDPEVQTGNGLLDEMIDMSIAAYRQNSKAAPTVN